MNLVDSSHFESTKEPTTQKALKDEIIDESDEYPTPIAKKQNRLSSVIPIAETPKSFEIKPFISFSKEEKQGSREEDKRDSVHAKCKHPSTSTKNKKKIQVITPQHKGNLNYAQTPQTRIKGGELMNNKKHSYV